jgi:hypothetical protein
MKKYVCLMAMAVCFAKVNAQSMYLGALVIDANAGIEGMQTE